MRIKKTTQSFILGVLSGVGVFVVSFLIGGNITFLDIQKYFDKTITRLPKTYVVYSGSMSPSLPAGSLIAVKPEKNYSVGDVVSFKRSGGQIVTHRVTKVLRDETSGGAVYETKGDANNASDRELISKEQIIGEGFFALPYLGYSISFLKTKTGFIVFAIIPSVLIILSEILSIKNEVNKLLGERKRKGKPTFSFRLFLLLLIVPFITIGRSNAYFSDKEASSGNVMSAGTWGEEEWNKSSLYFDEGYGCQGDCEEIRARVCNGEDAEDMEGTTTWELYWIESGNPKDGSVIDSGIIAPLEHGTCQVLLYSPNGAEGNYKFKAYQRPGHPGKGELWSETCELLHCAT